MNTFFNNPSILDEIDPEILDFVIVLNKAGFSTYSSCQGHTDDKHSTNFSPFVMFCNEYAANLKVRSLFNDSKEKLLKEYDYNLNNQKRLLEYLNQFYKNRSTKLRYRLTIYHCTYLRHSFETYFAEFTGCIDDPIEKAQYHKSFLKEVNDFTSFLKQTITDKD
jgi:hypothetical protein